jgi:transposase
MNYPTDLTDFQWKVISIFFDTQRKRKYCLRQILNAIFYQNRTGVQWRLLPKDFPPYGIVSYYYHQWLKQGLWQAINRKLVTKWRKAQGRCASPSVGIMDAQSVKHSLWGIGAKGFDGHKKIKGRKRHLVIDSLGLVLAAVVTVANIHDTKGGKKLLSKLATSGYDRMRVVIADSAYPSLENWLSKLYGWILQISPIHTKEKGFQPVPQRWKVERTFSWLNWNRRLIVDYERNISSSESRVLIANTAYLLKKI